MVNNFLRSESAGLIDHEIFETYSIGGIPVQECLSPEHAAELAVHPSEQILTDCMFGNATVG